MIEAAVLKAMLAQPVCYEDRSEPTEQRIELFRPVASAIAEVARNAEEAAALVAVEQNESRGCRYVFEGRCLDGPRGAQCDRSSLTGLPRARGPFQVWHFCKSAWDLPANSFESYRAGARCTVRLLRFGRSRHGTWVGAFSALLGTGQSHWVGAAARIRTMQSVLPDLLRAETEAA